MLTNIKIKAFLHMINRKRKFLVAGLTFLFLIKLSLLIWLWIDNEKADTGKKISIGRMMLIFPTVLLVFAGFCLWRLFLRLKVKQFN